MVTDQGVVVNMGEEWGKSLATNHAPRRAMGEDGQTSGKNQ